MYRVHDFARIAGVTVKTLHHYDRIGLLKARRNSAGYRMYAETDLARFEQIVALKFLGLPLRQIRTLLDRGPLGLPEALHLQRTVLEEKRRSLDCAIAAIRNAETVIQSGEAPNSVLREIIKAIQMQNHTEPSIEFMKNYYREESWVRFKATHNDWPSRGWNHLFREIADSLADDPAGPHARSLAARWRKLRVADSGGDPAVHAGLLKAWNDRLYWPDAVQRQFSEFDLDEVSSFIARAFASWRQAQFGSVVWVEDLSGFPPEEKERFTLSAVDLYFKIAETLDRRPAGEAAQALAARWMEVVESKTGNHPGAKGSYDALLRWIDAWPPSIHRKLRSLDMGKIFAFMVAAISHPMQY